MGKIQKIQVGYLCLYVLDDVFSERMPHWDAIDIPGHTQNLRT